MYKVSGTTCGGSCSGPYTDAPSPPSETPTCGAHHHHGCTIIADDPSDDGSYLVLIFPYDVPFVDFSTTTLSCNGYTFSFYTFDANNRPRFSNNSGATGNLTGQSWTVSANWPPDVSSCTPFGVVASTGAAMFRSMPSLMVPPHAKTPPRVIEMRKVSQKTISSPNSVKTQLSSSSQSNCNCQRK